MNKFLAAAAAFAALALPYAFAETADPACHGTALTGVVRDSTLALIPGATLSLDGTINQTSASDGSFRFPCVDNGRHHLLAIAPGFADHDLSLTTPHPASINLTLKLESVETQVEVGDDDNAASATSPTASGPSQTISGNRLQSLADDPDDLLRELQQMSATAGGMPSNATIKVDGFEGGDSSTLPPKDSIAYIKVNPDLFSSEYRQPPFGGGEIEVYTKPGQPTFHGSLFATNSSPWMNARDPFSTSKAALGKQRYGFSLSGPLRKKGADFTLNLEHRSNDNFAVVNAVTIDDTGTQSPLIQNVPTPQRLWVGAAKVDLQLAPKNTLIAAFNTYLNHQQNLGVGGSTLAEAAYDSEKYDHTLHLTDVYTISPKLMHEALVGIEWDGSDFTPVSTAPQIQVAGAFTSGGANLGAQRDHEIDIEVNDDAILNTGNHLMKFGTQFEYLRERMLLPTNFNGTYVFAGYTLPNGTPVSALQQYFQALTSQPGGSPTQYSNVAGSPTVNMVQYREALFFQDDWRVRSNVHFAWGLRYYTQTKPAVNNNFTPRFGVSWSPDKKATWTLHAHAGLFSGRFTAHSYSEILRMDGSQRVTSLIYNPTCSGAFNPATCTPFTGATPIHSERTVQPGMPNMFSTSKTSASLTPSPRAGISPPITTSPSYGTPPEPKTSTLPPTVSQPAHVPSAQTSTSSSGRPAPAATATSSLWASSSTPSSASSSSWAPSASISSTTTTTIPSAPHKPPESTPASTHAAPAKASGTSSATPPFNSPPNSNSVAISTPPATHLTTSPPDRTTTVTATSTTAPSTPPQALPEPSPPHGANSSTPAAQARFPATKASCPGPSISTATCSAPSN